jgi:hypothetical protein
MLEIWEGGYAFVLNICRWHFRNQKNLDRMFIWFFVGEESFETNLIVVSFCFCHDRLYFCVRMPCIDLLLMNLDSSCNLVKLLRALDKSLYRWTILWRVELLSRMKAIIEWVDVIDCNCQSVEDDSCNKAFWLLLMIFCYLCQCFCIVKYMLSKSWMFLCFSFWMGNAYCEK